MYTGAELGLILFELAFTGRNAARATRILRDAGGPFASIGESTLRRMRDRYVERIKQYEGQIVDGVIVQRLKDTEIHGT